MDDTSLRVLYLVLLLMVIGGTFIGRRRLSWSKTLEYGGIWLIVILLLMLAHNLYMSHQPGL